MSLRMVQQRVPLQSIGTLSARRALEVLPAPCRAEEALAIDHHVIPEENRAGVAPSLVALEHGAIHLPVMRFCADGVCGIRVP
jgi:hypothetical protein